MKLLYYKGDVPNFGDDLNPWLWSRLLPDFFDEDEREVFVGIGSILCGDFLRRYGPSSRKIVFGSGYVPAYFPAGRGERRSAPDYQGADWTFYCVRGPRTAAALGLSSRCVLGDPAILIRSLPPVQPPVGEPLSVAFMPHWESLERGHWAEVCDLAGIRLIDPRRAVDEVLAELRSCRLVIAEAMHGAIVADALRVPWIPILPLNKVHREKWLDWSEALGIRLARHRIIPSSLREMRLSFLHRHLVRSPLLPMADERLVHLAAASLRKIARATPMLSDDQALDRTVAQLLDSLERLKKGLPPAG